jgi:hypothetical protein
MASSTPKGTPYVVGSDVAGQYPETSHTLANHIDNVNANQDNRITAVESGKVAKTGDSMSGPLTLSQLIIGDDGFIQAGTGKYSIVTPDGSGGWQNVFDLYPGGACYLPTLRQSHGGGDINNDSHAMIRLSTGQMVHVTSSWFQFWLGLPDTQDLMARVETLEARIAELEA